MKVLKWTLLGLGCLVVSFVSTFAMAQSPEVYRIAGNATSMIYISNSSRSGLIGGLADQVTNSSTGPSLYSNQIRVIRTVCSTACFIAIGASNEAGNAPEAVAATGTFMPANEPEYFAVSPGEVVAVIQVSATGTLYIQQMTK